MRAYLCKTTWREWDSFLEIFTIEKAERLIWADSKIDAIYEFSRFLVDYFEKPENPFFAIYKENATAKQIKP